MLFIRKLDVRKITFGEVNTVPTNENEKFYLCLLGMPKSFTSSTSVYLKENYNLDFPNSNGAKEEESLLRPNFKIKHCKGDIVDATQSYLFQDDFFKNFYSINRKKYILIQHQDVKKQYERMFNMHFQSANYKFNLANKFMDGEDIPKEVKENYETNKENLKKYREFVARDVTDGEILHFFYKYRTDFQFKEATKIKMELLINGDIDRFFQHEIRQIRRLDFNNFSLLPLVMLPWVLDWLKKNNAHKISTVIKFEDADELVKKIDRFMLRIGKAKSSNGNFPYVSPFSHLRDDRKVFLSNSSKAILYRLEQSFSKK